MGLHFICCVPGVIGNKVMVLEPEEAVLKVTNPCCSVETRRPYGELGSVDTTNCLCCVGVSSDLSKQMPVFVGWGCDGILVATIVEELKKRMKVRGDTGNIQRIEAVQQQLKAVDRKLDLIMQHLS